MITEENVEKALEFMRDNASALAKAKAERVYLEQWRKSKKAILIQQAPDYLSSVAAKIEWAYAQIEYMDVLELQKTAVEEEERLKWLMTAAEAKVDVWRTQQATARSIDRGHQ